MGMESSPQLVNTQQGPRNQTVEQVPIFRDLGPDQFDTVFNLEQLAMNTDTTFPLSREELKAAFDRGDVFYGLFDGDTLCAKVGFTKEENNKFELDIMTHPDYQGKGLGRKIMQESIAALSSKYPGASIYLKVHPDNTRGVKLYESEHFVSTKTEETPHGPRIYMDFVPPKAPEIANEEWMNR